MTTTIGFAGAGLMGHGAVKHLLEHGYEVHIIAHRNRVPIDDLVARGAIERRRIDELAQAADVLFLCLPDADVVRNVVYGEHGVIAGAHKGLIVADLTTSLPDLTRRISEDLAEKMAFFVDAPMSRTPKEAEQGRLNLLLGGPEEAVRALRPVVDCFCEHVWHIGPTGAAHAFKLVNNGIVISNIATVLEACVAANRFGIDLTMLREICSAGGANSAMMQAIMPYAIEGDASTFQAHTSTVLKDLKYLNQMADAAGLSPRMSNSAEALFQKLVDTGHGEDLVPTLYDVLANVRD